MKQALHEVRCLIAEGFLFLALCIVPATSREGRAMAEALEQYAEQIEGWTQ